MTNDETSTPAFLLWAIEYSCPIRGFQNGTDPDHTERQLRSAVAVSAARRERRVFEGYCVDPPLGFRIDEALAIYGGLETVENTCGNCPANAKASNLADALAGCIGTLALPSDEREFYSRVDRAIEQLDLTAEYLRLFTATQPRWHGFWISSALTVDQSGFLAKLLEKLGENAVLDEPLTDLQAGLRVAHEHGFLFHADLHPRGRVQNNWWQLVPHCPRCKADWKSAGRGRCDVCEYVGHLAPEKKRRARGRRPYLPLERLMGKEAAAEFATRYEVWRQKGE